MFSIFLAPIPPFFFSRNSAIRYNYKKLKFKNSYCIFFLFKKTCLRSSLLRSSSAFLSSLFACGGIENADELLCFSEGFCAKSELLSSNKSKPKLKN